ncbi:MAG: acetyl-CoA carboxylase biotin carboxyl carrier protein subunit [Deltaproteobacteria bacterium]|nr:acetyl-CoA carboxylase biotin carboxyl carrier protein subunit [Deltaproteobacteria bacterium]
MATMRFVATLNGKERVIDVDNLGHDDGFYTMILDGVSHEVDAQLLKSHIVSCNIDHRSYDCDVEHTGDQDNTLDGRLAVRVLGRVVEMEMLDERRKKMKEAAGAQMGGGGAGLVESPMPGKVLKYLVAEGDEVKMGQGVVVVEAMKMENELKAACNGVVMSLKVSEGEAVESGAALVQIEPTEEE